MLAGDFLKEIRALPARPASTGGAPTIPDIINCTPTGRKNLRTGPIEIVNGCQLHTSSSNIFDKYMRVPTRFN